MEYNSTIIKEDKTMPELEPITYHLTPTQVKSLLVNNIWADTGKILEAEYFTKGE